MKKGKIIRKRGLVFFALVLILSISLAPNPARADDPAPDFPPPGPFALPEAQPPAGTPHIDLLNLASTLHLPVVRVGGDVLTVNLQSRADSLRFYQTYYLNAGSIPIAWTGSHAACAPGTTSADFRTAVLRRINYYRAMAGIPPVSLSDDYNYYAQAAAFLMSVNKDLSHDPPPSWRCYTADAATGAGRSNLAYGQNGWDAITGYMRDLGSGNLALGHRRWILYPRTRKMGTGDIPSTSGYPATNALYVFDADPANPRPTPRDEFVAWPPPGYVPRPVVFTRWSFSYPEADFSAASISMTGPGGSMPVNKFPIFLYYGENTLGWEPAGLASPGADTVYQVTIQNVIIGGQYRSFTYTVIAFDP